MLVVDEQAVTRSVWKEWKPNPAQPGIRTKLKPLTNDGFREIRQMVPEIIEEFKEKGITLTFDEALDIGMYREIFEDWNEKDVVDKNGDPLGCVIENIDTVCRLFPGYAKWAARTADGLSRELSDKQAKLLKNSRATQGSSETATPE